MQLLFTSLLLACTALSVNAGAKGSCEDYEEMFEIFTQSSNACKDLADAIPDGESGCELRDRIGAMFTYLVCFGTNENLRWMDEGGRLQWKTIEEDLQRIQVEDELEGLTQRCREAASTVPNGQLEATAMEIFGIEGIEAEEEECWYDGVACREVRRTYALKCISDTLTDALAEVCPTSHGFF